MRVRVLAVVVLLSLACGGLPSEEEPLDEPDVPIVTDTGTIAPPPPPRRRPGRARPAPPGSPAPPAAPAEPAPAPPAEDDKGPKRPPAPKPSGITQTGDQRWEVRRNLADRYKDDPYLLAKNAERSGDGWAVQGVRQRDAYHLGMRNGDVVLEVNGKKLKTEAQLLAAWLALKNKSSYDVLLLRKGKRRTHHYVVTD